MAFNLLDRYRASKHFYQLNLKYLFLVGLWPKENLNRNQLFLYKIYENTLHCFAMIFLVITGIKTYQIRDDTLMFLANIDKSIVAYNYFLKVIFFLIRRKELKVLIDDMSLAGDLVTERSKNTMINLLLFVTIFTTSLVFLFSTLGLLNGDMSIEVWMPFDAKKNKMNLILADQIIAVLFCIPFSYRAIGMQGIVCSIMIYICDQLKRLQNDIQNFKYSKEDEIKARDNFKKIFLKHVRLMKYSTSMKIMFKEYFLVQNIAITMELCLNAMVVTMVGKAQKNLLGGFLSLLGLALLNSYIYCKLGNELINQSIAVAAAAYSSACTMVQAEESPGQMWPGDMQRDVLLIIMASQRQFHLSAGGIAVSLAVASAAYSSAWTTWPGDMQRDVLLIIMASQRPFHLSAGGIAAVDMKSFGTALYNGYSIFAVLNDMVEH